MMRMTRSPDCWKFALKNNKKISDDPHAHAWLKENGKRGIYPPTRFSNDSLRASLRSPAESAYALR